MSDTRKQRLSPVEIMPEADSHLRNRSKEKEKKEAEGKGKKIEGDRATD